MFDVDNIYTNHSGNHFLCDSLCESESQAQYIMASFLLPVRENYFLADLSVHGRTLILDTPVKEVTITLAHMLNKAIMTMH